MLLDYLVRKSDFSTLLKFVSPNFFKVVSPKTVLILVNKLRANQGDKKAWQDICKSHATFLEKHKIGVILKPQGLEADHKNIIGDNALRLFFLQILGQRKWIIDFRKKSFSEGDENLLIWTPSPLYYELPETFLKNVRGLYCGYYLGDEPLFNQALEEMDLLSIKSTFIKHFGPEDQESVQFKLAHFQKTFADIFEACSKNGICLKPEFFILGILLLGLYEYLESSEKSYDVRKAFFAAHRVIGEIGGKE